MASKVYDYIIVGGGTAGLVLAARLSEDANVQVLILEAGDDQTDDPKVKTPAMWAAMTATPADWGFQTVPQDALSGRAVHIPQGRLLGGSSALNGLIFTINSKINVDAWERLGNPGWNWETYAKYLAKVYTLAHPTEELTKQFSLEYIDDKMREASGPVQISFPVQPDNEWPRVWLDTLANTGHPLKGNPFSGEAHGVSINTECVDATNKQRSYSASAYLEPVRHRSNLTVLTGVTVDKVIFDTSGPDEPVAKGVQITKENKTSTVHTNKEVILSAGPLNSPKLLELSGIGNPDILREFGVEVIVVHRAVGENLQNHPVTAISFEVEDGYETMDGMVRKNPAFIASAMEQYKKQAGPFASSNTFAYAQIPTPDINTVHGQQEIEDAIKKTSSYVDEKSERFPFFTERHQDYVHSVLRSDSQGSGCYIAFPGHISYADDGSLRPVPPGTEGYFTIGVLLAHPLSRGSVHLKKGAYKDLAIDPRFLSNPLDVEIQARHLQFIEQGIVASEPMASRLKPAGKRNETAPPPGSFNDLQAAKDYVLKTSVGAHHFTSTCAMMPREMGGVVDSKLRVYGCKNLRVCDASVIPLVPRTNPQSTVYTIAEMAADIIKST